MSTVKKDNRLEIRVTVSESDPDSDLVALVTYMKSLGKGSKPLISKALKAFYLPLSLNIEPDDRDKLTSVRVSSLKCLLQQVQEILFASYEDGVEIPEYLLSFGRSILREETIHTGLNSQPVSTSEKAETPISVNEIKNHPTQVSEDLVLDRPEDDEEDDENPFGHITLPSGFDPEVGKIDVNL